ncbi:MAG TPA: nitroreductase family protein [bacterium]|nr:nitroreductase family protein [bacterium]HPQ67402.1 nitroreductase family protein [bacterium]
MEYRETVERRRAINFFDPQARITAGDLREIVERGVLAPSSFNLQPWKVVAAVSPEVKEALCRAAFDQPKVREASAVLVLLGNLEAVDESDDVFAAAVEQGYLAPDQAHGKREQARALYAGREKEFVSRNVALLGMNLMLAATDLGWSTHPMDGFDAAAVAEALALEEKYLPVMLVAVGRPSPRLRLLPRPTRRGFDRVCEVR